jgi:hypothetical protein
VSDRIAAVPSRSLPRLLDVAAFSLAMLNHADPTTAAHAAAEVRAQEDALVADALALVDQVLADVRTEVEAELLAAVPCAVIPFQRRPAPGV